VTFSTMLRDTKIVRIAEIYENEYSDREGDLIMGLVPQKLKYEDFNIFQPAVASVVIEIAQRLQKVTT